jgi:hypothetical protein
MRLRVGAALCLFLAFWGSGCRKALAPTTLDNQPPETWIVAAPQDTITTRDAFNQPIRPQIGKIPVRFHMYWAGTDRDGSVAGFYWAVVETLPVPPEGAGSVPALPGPKARDYHYTTATDSMFIFRASEEVSERQHAFYIYAVDNKGRPDPTPARFIFSAYDRFPPTAVIDECKATGTEYILLPGGGVQPIQKTYFVTGLLRDQQRSRVPARHGDVERAAPHALARRAHDPDHDRHRLPLQARRAELQHRGLVGARDQLQHRRGHGPGEPGAQDLHAPRDRPVGLARRGHALVPDELRARHLVLGPRPERPRGAWLPAPMPYGGKYRDFEFIGWETLSKVPNYTVPNSMLAEDSLRVLPALRVERKAFFEVYNDKLWVRQENDTVHLNSWVIIPAGGFDRTRRTRSRSTRRCSRTA